MGCSELGSRIKSDDVRRPPEFSNADSEYQRNQPKTLVTVCTKVLFSRTFVIFIFVLSSNHLLMFIMLHFVSPGFLHHSATMVCCLPASGGSTSKKTRHSPLSGAAALVKGHTSVMSFDLNFCSWKTMSYCVSFCSMFYNYNGNISSMLVLCLHFLFWDITLNLPSCFQSSLNFCVWWM